MRRGWGLLGLLILAACTGVEDELSKQNHEECSDVAEDLLSQHVELSSARAMPQPEAGDGREAVIIRYRQASGVSAASVSRLGGQVKAQYRFVPAVAARVTPEERARLAADPDVERIEPDLELRPLGMPSAIGSAEEYTDSLRLVQASRVWDANEDGVLDTGAPTGAGIRVCVIDSGIDPRHPELAIPYVGGRDFVDEDDDPSDQTGEVRGIGHGTHVAGIIAAQLGSGGATYPGMNAGGMMGVAPGAQLLIARVLNVQERASVSNVLRALEWCQQQKARIASLSLGSPVNMGRTAQEAFQAARDAGMLIIAASGNDSSPEREAPISYPAAFPSVLAVGAVDSLGEVASFSNRGDGLSLVAPGVDVLSSVTLQGVTVSELEARGQQYGSRSLFFVPAGEYTGTLVDCGAGESRGCKGGTCDGFVAYVRLMPGYSPTRLALNVMKQGAKAVIFGTEQSDSEPWQLALDGPGRRWVPTLAVGRESRAAVLKNLGKQVHVNLRGVDYAYFPGTSMATPHVTGVAALVWSANPSLTASEVRQLLESTAKDLGESGKDPRYGYGLVQAKAALDALRQRP
jgi:subtilisin family serine protease